MGSSQTWLRPSATLKSNISKWNWGIGVLQQLGTTWPVSIIFSSQKSLHPNVYDLCRRCGEGSRHLHRANHRWEVIQMEAVIDVHSPKNVVQSTELRTVKWTVLKRSAVLIYRLKLYRAIYLLFEIVSFFAGTFLFYLECYQCSSSRKFPNSSLFCLENLFFKINIMYYLISTPQPLFSPLVSRLSVDCRLIVFVTLEGQSLKIFDLFLIKQHFI